MDYKALLSQLNVTMRVPVSVVDPSGETLCCFPDTEHHFLPAFLASQELDRLDREQLAAGRPRMRSGDFSTLIGAVRLSDGNYLMVGPCASEEVELTDVVSGVPDFVSRDDVMAMYRVYRQSNLTEAVGFANIMALLARLIHGTEILPVDIIRENFAVPEVPEKHVPVSGYSTPVDSLLLFESRVRSAVQSGNVEELEQIWKAPLPLVMEQFAHSEENEKYFIIPYLTIISRAAIDGGAVSEKAFVLYDSYTRRFQACKNVAECFNTVVSASMDFCGLVRESAGVDVHFELCRICEKYINDHIAEKITALDLARACNVDRSDIFDIFRSNFHMSLTEFIQRERLRRAEILMLNTSYTIGQVSAALGFVSQGYFSKVFAKYHGCTPGEYRSRNVRN